MVLERFKRILRHRDLAGKFTKAEAYYIDDVTQKPFRCGNCKFYDGQNNQCDLVSGEGPPGRGRISRQGSCTLWNASVLRIQALQQLWGREGEDGIAPETIRATMFVFVYATVDEEPPDEIKEKSLVDWRELSRRSPSMMSRISRISGLTGSNR